MNTKCKTIDEMIDKSESSAGKTKFKFHLDFSNFYDQMNYL